MRNFKIIPTERPSVFTLENENGVWIADVNGRELADKLKLLPQMIGILNELVDNQGLCVWEQIEMFLQRNNLRT